MRMSVEPIVLAVMASAMLFPWRVITRRKCAGCGMRAPRRQHCPVCVGREPV